MLDPVPVMPIVWEMAGTALKVRGFVMVKADKGLVARFFFVGPDCNPPSDGTGYSMQQCC